MLLETRLDNQDRKEEIEPRKAFHIPVVTPSQPAQADIEKAKELLAKYQEEAQEISPENYKCETHEVIDRLDIKVLKDIFGEYRRRSGMNDKDFLVEKQGISVASGNGGDFNEGHIIIGAGFLHPKDLYPEEKRTKMDFRNQILCALLHEETHAASFNYYAPSKYKKGGWRASLKSFFQAEPFLAKQSGFRRAVYKKGTYNKTSFRNFNEGVTDKVAEEVYTEYLKRTGDRDYFIASGQTTRYIESYLGPRAMVTAFVEILAKAEGVPSDQIWNAVKQGYMSGLDLQNNDLVRSFDEIFFPEVMKKMGSNTVDERELPNAELQKLAENIQLPQESIEKIKKSYKSFLSYLEAEEARRMRIMRTLKG